MYLGIEIGGTKLQLGVGTGDGAELVALERRTVAAERGAAGIREMIGEVGRELLARYAVRQVGIGFGGPVVAAEGRVLTSHQIAGWDDFPLTDWCRQTLGVPAIIGNDCDVAALAESRYGAGRGRRIVFYVTVGTGVGGGLVVDGQIFGTHRPACAEIGHLRPGLRPSPGDDVEAIGSGRGIEQAARRRIAESGPGSLQHVDAAALRAACGDDLARLTARQIAEAAGCGNALARDVLSQACETLGWAIAQTITLVAPEVVVIGGGVSLIGERLFFDPVRAAVRRYAFPALADACPVLPAELGELTVVHGAVALAAAASC